MQEKALKEALAKMRDASKERKFTQTAELIINFRALDMKKPDNRVSVNVVMPHEVGKGGEVKALVFVRDKGFASQLKGKHDSIMEGEIAKLKKKQVSEIIGKYNAFFAEGPVMLTVGKYLGQELAPKGLMPKPIQPSMAALESGLAGVSTGIKVSNNKGRYMPVVHCPIGTEKNSDGELTANALAVYSTVVKALPQKDHNIKSSYVKLTMGPAIKIGVEEKQRKR